MHRLTCLPCGYLSRRTKSLITSYLGIKSYRQLQYLFDLLIQHEQFDLLLLKDTSVSTGENFLLFVLCSFVTYGIESKLELRLALHRYLSLHHSHDSQKLQSMFVSFQMWREMADMIDAQVRSKISRMTGDSASSSVTAFSSPNLSSPQALKTLYELMQDEVMASGKNP